MSGRLPRSSSQVQRVILGERERDGGSERERERAGGWGGSGYERESERKRAAGRLRCALLLRCCVSPATRDRCVCGVACRGPLRARAHTHTHTHTHTRTAAATGHLPSIAPPPNPDPSPSFHLTPSHPCPQSRAPFCTPLSRVHRGWAHVANVGRVAEQAATPCHVPGIHNFFHIHTHRTKRRRSCAKTSKVCLWVGCGK